MEVGSRFAYRASARQPYAQVEVVKIGTKRPTRVKISFVEDQAEGRTEWVSPARLTVPWERVDQQIASEARWNAVQADLPAGSQDPQFAAAELVMDTCGFEELATLGWKGREFGLLLVHDVPGFAAALDVQPDLFSSDPISFTEDGILVAPWATALPVAQRAAARFAERVLTEIEQREESARVEAVYGHHMRGRRGVDPYFSPQVCMRVDVPYKAARDLARTWCGQQDVDRHAELAALRVEVRRVGALAEEAIRALHTAGHTRIAKDLEERLGVPLEALRQAPEFDTLPPAAPLPDEAQTMPGDP